MPNDFTTIFGEDSGFNFNLDDIEKPKQKTFTNKFEPIPAGIYQAEIIKEEFKTSKAGNKYLSLTFKITSGQYKGRLVFDTFNLYHPKEKVVNMARAAIKQLATATGVTDLKVTNPFLDKTCLINVIIEANDEYGDKNRISDYVDKKEYNEGTLVDKNDTFPF